MTTITPDPTPVPVPPWVILAAIRYGLPRLSYAHSESLGLIAQHADLLAAHGWLGTVTEDVTRHCHGCRNDPDHAAARTTLGIRGWETDR